MLSKRQRRSDTAEAHRLEVQPAQRRQVHNPDAGGRGGAEGRRSQAMLEMLKRAADLGAPCPGVHKAAGGQSCRDCFR